jgi:hypothetical protein
LKHYYAKELEFLVRDGVVNIRKLEFFGLIERVRQKAFKKTTILSAFQKTGISPFNPNIVLDVLRNRVDQKTPTPEPALYSDPESSIAGTPHTCYRKINRLANHLTTTIDNFEEISTPTRHLFGRFIWGSLVNAAELLQTRRDLGRTKAAEHLNKMCRAGKNQRLQTGGVLKVAEGRRMALAKEIDEEEKLLKKAARLAKRRQRAEMEARQRTGT